MRALAIALLVACHSSAPKVHGSDVHVDRRVELIAILQRLAGGSEYTQALPTPYVADVDRAFAPFAQHPAVAMTRQLRDRGIGYDAPMQLAVHLDDQLAVHGTLDDARWKDVDVAAYAAQLRAFAADAKLDAFLAAHAAYVRAVEHRFAAALDAENPGTWFDGMFGASGQRFVVVPALLNGPASYGVHDDAAMYQIMGLGQVDADGLPVVDEDVIATLVHEMAHSFVNPLVERHWGELRAPAEALFGHVHSEMQHQAYGAPQIMVDEAVVRAVTVVYARDRKPPQVAADTTRDQVRRGFYWTSALADLLAHHRREVDKAVPELAALFARTASEYAEHGLPQLPFLGPITPGLARLGVKGTGDDPAVAELARRAGWKLDDHGLVLGSRTFTGPGLVLVACWPKPDDPAHGVVVYQAARASDLEHVDDVPLRGMDWAVLRKRADGRFDRVAIGNFHVTADNRWQLP
ncbi:MAG: DUF4932 domain-containing protein [Acidobacteriota bacterium]